MKRKMFFVLGLVLSMMVGVQAWGILSVQAQTKPDRQAWTPSIVQAQLPTVSGTDAEVINEPKPEILPQPQISQQEASARALIPFTTSLCYTCGGSWPIDGGQIDLTSGSTPLERGRRCSGGLRRIVDKGPRICSS